MDAPLRISTQTEQVIRALLQNPTQPQYGRNLAAQSGLKTGTIHPILARLEQIGWVESFWESDDQVEHGRPRRRYYRFTQDGAESARIALAEADAKRRKASSQLSPQLGF